MFTFEIRIDGQVWLTMTVRAGSLSEAARVLPAGCDAWLV